MHGTFMVWMRVHALFALPISLLYSLYATEMHVCSNETKFKWRNTLTLCVSIFVCNIAQTPELAHFISVVLFDRKKFETHK